MKTVKTMLSKKINDLRMQKHLSLMDLAKKIGVSDVAISKWEKGKNEPKATYLVALADYFLISTDELLGRENFVTGNIEVIGERLTDKEQCILSNFRKLSSGGQEALIDISELVVKVEKN